MKKLLRLPATFLASVSIPVRLAPLFFASAARAQEVAASAPVPGQDGLNSAFFWFGLTVVAMVLALYAVHRSVFRTR